MVLLDRSDSVVVLTLNRPERHNSLVPPLLRAMLEALRRVRTQPGARVVVLQANGRSFSTGGDLGGFYEHLDSLETYASSTVGLLNQILLAMLDLPVPIVTAVHGIVSGGSMGFVLASDIVLVAPEASFTPYYSVVGFSPDGGWTALLPTVIGPQRTADVLMRNATITADQAVAWGIASRIAPAIRIREKAMTTARALAAAESGSILHTKRLLSATRGDVAGRLEVERLRFIQQIQTDQARRGIIGFMEQRRKGPQ